MSSTKSNRHLPPVKAAPHPTEIDMQPSELVIVRVKYRDGDCMAIGRYLHAIDGWRVDGFSGDAPVLEWWPMPDPGTGKSVEN